MADGQEDRSREDLTEDASPARIEEYRRKGQVAQSREVSALFAFLATAVTTYLMAPRLGMQLGEFMREVFRTDLSSRVDLGGTHILANYLIRSVKIAAAVGLPIGFLGFFFGAVGSFIQIGSIFSMDPLTPDLGKINPLTGWKRVVSMKQGIDGLKMIFKMSILIAVAYGLVKAEVMASPAQLGNDVFGVLHSYGHAAKSVFLTLIMILATFAAIDFGFQKWEFSKNLRMTKQEAKQEHREREGDPAIKARIRQAQREIARRRMVAAVKKADVIITNPTHIAIAITYEKDAMAAPKVVAKGADLIAQKIKQIAAEAGVPLVENIPLARTLYSTVKVGQYVPRALYQAIAEVLAYVYRLKKRDM